MSTIVAVEDYKVKGKHGGLIMSERRINPLSSAFGLFSKNLQAMMIWLQVSTMVSYNELRMMSLSAGIRSR